MPAIIVCIQMDTSGHSIEEKTDQVLQSLIIPGMPESEPMKSSKLAYC